MIMVPGTFAMVKVAVCTSDGLPTVCEKLSSVLTNVVATGFNVCPVTATFTVVAPAEAFVILPAYVPAADAFNRTLMVVGTMVSILRATTSAALLLYQVAPSADTSNPAGGVMVTS